MKDSDKLLGLMKNYNILKYNLGQLNETKREKGEVVFGYACSCYIDSQNAMKYLSENLSDEEKKLIGLRDLETELHKISNTHIKL